MTTTLDKRARPLTPGQGARLLGVYPLRRPGQGLQGEVPALRLKGRGRLPLPPEELEQAAALPARPWPTRPEELRWR